MNIDSVDLEEEDFFTNCSWPPSSISKNYEIPGKELMQGRIGGIAGIGTSLCGNEKYANKISRLAGNTHVDWTYNASHSIPIDILETLLFNYKGFSYPAYLLIQAWEKFASDYADRPNAKYFQICHSQGASHVKIALSMCREDLRKKIIVLNLAPSEIIPERLCNHAYNYVSKRDFIWMGKYIKCPLLLTNELKELTLLGPHPKTPFFDHGFWSHTFREVLSDHLKKFILN